MRIVFAGTPDVALPTLRALMASEHEVVGVITRPPAPRGRSKKLVDSPVGAFAKSNGLNLLETSRPSLDDDLCWIRSLEADTGVVVAYGALLTPAVLESVARGWINLHFSSLPDLRGAAPVQRAILRGDTEIGTTVFLLDPGMDSGPIINTRRHLIGPTASSGEALTELSEAGATQVIDALRLIENPEFMLVPQDTGTDNSLVTVAPKLNKQDGFVDFRNPSTEIVNRIRALTPMPGAWTLDSAGNPMKLRGGTVSDIRTLQPGEVHVARQELLIGTTDTALVIQEVAPAGKSWMRAADWARGARLGSDARLGVEDSIE